ncbi:MAG: phage N-6-adenine-methyltransferase [Dehalococcoidia bacterium]|nr:phage N-6-adenine-methyltransferase [Dehalococcoidia bacterium]
MTRPAQRPGSSRQDYGTPPEFLRAVERRFGPVTFDLAAHAGNSVVPGYHSPADDSLVQDWTRHNGTLWCNPPFGRPEPWAAKCARSKGPGRRILLLTPASVSTEWFADHIYGQARVYAVRPRLTFVGCTASYPGDLILSVYDPEMTPAFCLWRWDR